MDLELTDPLGRLSPLYDLGTELTIRPRGGGTGSNIKDSDIAETLANRPNLLGTTQEQAINDAVNTARGIRAYHGSPHEFEKFESSKIGTGEGAQAYGHGLYFAEAEPVAKQYRDKLAMGQSTLDKKPMSEVASEKYKLPYGTDPTIEHDIADIVSSYGDTARFVMESRHPHLLSHYDKLVEEGRIKQPGHMYEVNINAHPDHFLNWDKPLSEQSEHVQNAIKLLPYANHAVMEAPESFRVLEDARSAWMTKTGQDTRGDQKHRFNVSRDLHKAGIQGIKYLDAGSRNQGEGSRNYVVFDPKDIEIMRRYARGGDVRAHFAEGGGSNMPDDEVQKAINAAKDINLPGAVLREPEPSTPFSEVQTYVGNILPITKYADNSVRFNSDAGVLGALKRAFTASGRAMQGEFPVFEMDEEGNQHVSQKAIDESMNLANSIMLGTAPLGAAQVLREGYDPNVVRSFASVASRTANRDALAEAVAMEQRGRNRDEIWARTGWGRNPAGQWFYEIPDDRMRMRTLPTDYATGEKIGRESTFGNEVDHPYLLEAHPDLENMRFEHGLLRGRQGYYVRPSATEIERIAVGTEGPRSVTIHEIQHALQQRENLPRGGNPKDPVLIGAARNLSERANTIIENLQEQRGVFVEDLIDRYKINPKNTAEIANAYKYGNDLWARQNPEKNAALQQAYLDMEVRGPTAAYMNLAGEIEARISDASRDMTHRQRLENPPWRRSSGSVPYSSRIIRFGDEAPYVPEFNINDYRQRYATKGFVSDDEPVGDPADLLPPSRSEDPADVIMRKMSVLPEALSGLGESIVMPGINAPGRMGAAAPSAVASSISRSGADIIAKDPVLAAKEIALSKFGKSMRDAGYEYDPKNNLVTWKEKTPEQLYREGAYVAPALGDRSAANMLIKSIGGNKLSEPLSLQGGGDFMRSEFARGDNPAAWASRTPTAQRILKQIREQAPEGAPVYMSHTVMGLPASDSSHMMASAILRQIEGAKGKIDPVAAAKLDLFLEKKFPNWPGIMNPVAAEQYLAGKPGKWSTEFAKALDRSAMIKGKLPDVGETRLAITDPRLISAEQLASGYALSKLDPNAPVFTKGLKHGTYGGKLPSESGYEGGFRFQVPSEIMFPDWASKLPVTTKRGLPPSATEKQQALMTQTPVQKANQQWLDSVMGYIEANPRPWGYRDGGRTSGNDAVGNALSAAREHFGFGGADRDAAEGSSYSDNISHDAPDIEVGGGRGVNEGPGERAAYRDAMRIGPTDFGRGIDVSGVKMSDVEPPKDIREYTQQRLTQPYEGSPINAAMYPGEAFGMAYPSLVGKLHTRAGAAGLLGNAQYESAGFNPAAMNQSGATGLFQNLGERKTGMLNALGIDPKASPEAIKSQLEGTGMPQLGYALNEIATQKIYAPTERALTKGTDPYATSGTVMRNFERPSDVDQAISEALRAAYSNQIDVGIPSWATAPRQRFGFGGDADVAEGSHYTDNVTREADNPNRVADQMGMTGWGGNSDLGRTTNSMESINPTNSTVSVNTGREFGPGLMSGLAVKLPGDPRANLENLEALDPSFQGQTTELLTKMREAGMNPYVTSTDRSLAQQAAMRERYLSEGGKYPVAEPGNSFHNFDRAFDVGGLTPDQMAQAGAMAKGMGMGWGGDFSTPDPIHFQQQPAGTSAREWAKANDVTATGFNSKPIFNATSTAPSQPQTPIDIAKETAKAIFNAPKSIYDSVTGGINQANRKYMDELLTQPNKVAAPTFDEEGNRIDFPNTVSGQTKQEYANQFTGGDPTKVKERISYMNGQPQVEYYAKDLGEALFGGLFGNKNNAGSTTGQPTSPATSSNQSYIESLLAQPNRVAVPTLDEEGNPYAWPNTVTGQTKQEYADQFTFGDPTKVRERISYVNGQPQVEYYAKDFGDIVREMLGGRRMETGPRRMTPEEEAIYNARRVAGGV